MLLFSDFNVIEYFFFHIRSQWTNKKRGNFIEKIELQLVYKKYIIKK